MPESIERFLKQDWWKPMAVLATVGLIVAYFQLNQHLAEENHPRGVMDQVRALRDEYIGYGHETAILQWRVNQLEERIKELEDDVDSRYETR